MLFQSTPPHGERPIRNFPKGPAMIFQSTLPHGERLLIACEANLFYGISIHAPAWERRGWQLAAARNGVFQSMLPHGERPSAYYRHKIFIGISIHAPRMGSDASAD